MIPDKFTDAEIIFHKADTNGEDTTPFSVLLSDELGGETLWDRMGFVFDAIKVVGEHYGDLLEIDDEFSDVEVSFHDDRSGQDKIIEDEFVTFDPADDSTWANRTRGNKARKPARKLPKGEAP